MRFPNLDQELETVLSGESEAWASSPVDGEGTEELQLAAELLGVSNEEELEQFLSGLISKATGFASSFLKSPAGQQLGGLLKSAAKKALPQLGQAVGGHFGGDTGAQLGAQAAAKAAQMLGLELEGLTNEDSEFELSRQFTRFASDAAQRAARAGGSAADARRAYTEAAREHAPGLIPSVSSRRLTGFPTSGRWVRRGGTITLT